jgi:hypothetical protein
MKYFEINFLLSLGILGVSCYGCQLIELVKEASTLVTGKFYI